MGLENFLISPEDKQVIKDYLEYKVQYNLISAKSYRDYEYNLYAYAHWVRLHRSTGILQATAQDIMAYRNSINKRNATIVSYLSPVKTLYKWLAHPTHAILPVNPWPDMRLPRGSKHASVIPSAEQVFSIRKGGSLLNLHNATIMELILSSGMRVNELRQIRAVDIDWNKRPYDFEFKGDSPFCGGGIELNPTFGVVIKQRRRRIVYFSKLTAKLLRVYIQRIGIDAESMSPLFPITSKQIWTMITKLKPYANLQREEKKRNHRREAGFLDLDVDKMDGTPEYKELLRRAQQLHAKQNVDNPFSKVLYRTEPVRRVYLHPHAFRHFFGMCQYYRNWFGNRRDLLGIKDLLGHHNLEEVTTYATSQLVVKNDLQWKQVMCGNGFDYQRLFYGC